MKKLVLTFSYVCAFILMTQAQGSLPLAELKLVGTWHIDSVSFRRPVDINKDGVKNDNAVKEYSTCLRVQLLTFKGDYTAESSIGKGVDGCKESNLKYSNWILEKKVDREDQRKYDNDKDKKSIKKPEKKMYLTLKDEDEDVEFLVMSLTKNELQLVGYVSFDDSSEPAMMVWKKGE